MSDQKQNRQVSPGVAETSRCVFGRRFPLQSISPRNRPISVARTSFHAQVTSILLPLFHILQPNPTSSDQKSIQNGGWWSLIILYDLQKERLAYSKPFSRSTSTGEFQTPHALIQNGPRPWSQPFDLQYQESSRPELAWTPSLIDAQQPD